MQQGAVIERGRFELDKGFVRGEWLRNGGFALFMLVFGGGMAVYGAYIVRDLLEVARIWEHGTESSSEVGYGGKVVTHNFLLKDYELQVTFLPDEADEPLTFEADFYRFFTGPDDGEPMTVRYEPGDPSHAVSSWQHDGLIHGWVWALVIWGLALTGVLTAIKMVRDHVATVAKVKELAHEGQLMRAQVEEAKRGGTAQQPVVVLHYKTPRGETSKQTFALKRGEPYMLDDGQVLVLSSVDERRSYALRADGYPLAVRPDVQPATTAPA